MASSSLYAAPHPLVPVATFNVADGQPAALEGGVGAAQGELALLGGEAVRAQQEVPSYSLFPSEEAPGGGDGPGAPDFLGRLHHLKTLFRMSATQEPVSVMIHRVGPLLILDDGPCGWSHGDSEHSQQPLPPLSGGAGGCGGRRPLETDAQLMLAALEPSLAEAIARGPPGLELPPGAPGHRLCVRNTFVDVVESDAEEEEAARGGVLSAPACLGAASPATPRSSGSQSPGTGTRWDLPLSPVVQRLQEHAEQAASRLSLIPYQPEAGEGPLAPASEAEGGPGLLGSRHLDLLQLASAERKVVKSTSRVLEAVRSLYSGIPPQPSRCGRAVEWRCGPFKVLLGCDLVVLRSDEKCEASDFASFKMLPPGSPSAGPSREERIDVYLENLMCDITKAVWGSHQQGRTTWRVFDTADLPAAAPGEAEGAGFDGQLLQEQGQRLLHFLRQRCHREGGTYWLFRERNSSAAELFDLSASASPATEEEASRAFRTTPSLAPPIASLCLHLAKGMPDSADQRQLLEKGLHLLEPVKEDHAALYSMTALQLACSYMRTPLAAIPDRPQAGAAGSAAEPPLAARLTLALRYLEGILRLLTSLDDTDRDEVALLAELGLQAHVAYTECILKLVREACIPTYSRWLTDVQRASQEALRRAPGGGGGAPPAMAQMKKLSAALLLWRLFWLCRAHRALALLPSEKRETECWTLDRDLCESTGDALYGLSRYPADDVGDLAGGQMATAEGICKLVEDGLRSWGLHGAGLAGQGRGGGRGPQRSPVSRPGARGGGRRLPSPSDSDSRSPSPAGVSGEEPEPHDVGAMLLSSLNPLTRGVGDDALREDPLVRDGLRRALWTEGRALAQSLAFFERATARLRRAPPSGEEGAAGGQRRPTAEDQATIKVARKLAHLYNEEARAKLLEPGGGEQGEVEALLSQARRWMMLSGDRANAARVLLNLSELHARRAESLTGSEDAQGEPEPFAEAQYALWMQAVECCEEAAALSENGLGKKEGAFAHLRVGVHLSLRVPCQSQLAGSKRSEPLVELAGRHLSKALLLFDELHEEREVAVCHFHMADLLLQEQRSPNAAAVQKPRLIAALRHARRSAEYWERAGALQYPKDYISSHIRVARLMECQQRPGAVFEALAHLCEAEAHLVALARAGSQEAGEQAEGEALFVLQGPAAGAAGGRRAVAVTALRREMARICQAGLRQGDDVERLKAAYRSVLRNEAVAAKPGPAGVA